MKLLDLFCCEGGAGAGYSRAGFDVTGVDVVDRTGAYPYRFVQADALEYLAEHGHEYDAIHASPPCQAFTSLGSLSDNVHPDLLTPTLALLVDETKPWVVENVVGAPVPNPFTLCGSMFGLGAVCEDGVYRQLRRHRRFASNLLIMVDECNHVGNPVGVYGMGGAGGRNKSGNGSQGVRGYKAGLAVARVAIGMPWGSRYGVSQSIPPVYTEYIGEFLIDALKGS